MAAQTLTKGISFRRQGSSGLTWTDTWNVTENGVYIMKRPQERNTKPGLSPQSEFLDARHTTSGTSVLFPNNSVCDAPPAATTEIETEIETAIREKSRSGSRFMKWVKRALKKFRT
eukprot:c24137_g1_i2 orf=989-1336(-)